MAETTIHIRCYPDTKAWLEEEFPAAPMAAKLEMLKQAYQQDNE